MITAISNFLQQGVSRYNLRINRLVRQREDFYYKTTHKLVKEYDHYSIGALTLKVSVRNTKLPKSILAILLASSKQAKAGKITFDSDYLNPVYV